MVSAFVEHAPNWLDAFAYGIGIRDADGRLIYCNRTLGYYFGYEPEDLRNQYPTDILDEDNYRVYLEQQEERRRGCKQPYRLTFKTRGRGSFRAVLFPSPRFDELGKFIGTTAVFVPGDLPFVFEGTADAASRPDLTPRESEVMNLLVEGKNAQEVSGQLGISVHTARNHTKSIYLKCGVNSQVELILRVLGR